MTSEITAANFHLTHSPLPPHTDDIKSVPNK